MRFGYSCRGKALSSFSKQLMVMAGLLVLPFTLKLEKSADARSTSKPRIEPPLSSGQFTLPGQADPRPVRLKKFLSRLRCPVAPLSDDFVQAADDNHLDWRLLPSISVIESGGGKEYRNNNIFGWANGSTLFPTLRSGIATVAYKLGKSPLYRDKSVYEKLRLYNPDETYANAVLGVMNRISPIVNLQPVQRLTRRHNEFVYASD